MIQSPHRLKMNCCTNDSIREKKRMILPENTESSPSKDELLVKERFFTKYVERFYLRTESDEYFAFFLELDGEAKSFILAALFIDLGRMACILLVQL